MQYICNLTSWIGLASLPQDLCSEACPKFSILLRGHLEGSGIVTDVVRRKKVLDESMKVREGKIWV